MARKKRFKELVDIIVYAMVACLQFFLLRVSRESAMKFAEVLARFIERAAKRPRKIIEDNLKFVYGEKLDSAARQKLLSDIFCFQTKGAVEAMILPRFSKRDVENLVTLENACLLDDALKKGNGALLLAGHFVDGGLGILRIASNYPLGVIYRPFRNQRLFSLLSKPLRDFNVQMLPRGEKSSDYLKALSENKVLTTAVDQHAEEKGVTIPFMGKPAQTACGWVVLAQKSKAPVLVAFCLRGKNHSYRFIFEDPGEMTFSGDLEKDLYENTLKVQKIIESYVYKYPEQWFWVHKRWKALKKGGVRY